MTIRHDVLFVVGLSSLLMSGCSSGSIRPPILSAEGLGASDVAARERSGGDRTFDAQRGQRVAQYQARNQTRNGASGSGSDWGGNATGGYAAAPVERGALGSPQDDPYRYGSNGYDSTRQVSPPGRSVPDQANDQYGGRTIAGDSDVGSWTTSPRGVQRTARQAQPTWSNDTTTRYRAPNSVPASRQDDNWSGNQAGYDRRSLDQDRGRASQSSLPDNYARSPDRTPPRVAAIDRTPPRINRSLDDRSIRQPDASDTRASGDQAYETRQRDLRTDEQAITIKPPPIATASEARAQSAAQDRQQPSQDADATTRIARTANAPPPIETGNSNVGLKPEQRHGIAQWMGRSWKEFKTASGEIFDPEKLTGAHPTLPLPSFVYVTNPANQRTLLIRVNDRSRIQDGNAILVSRRAADYLGFRRAGKAEVDLQYAGPASVSPNMRHEEAFLRSQPWYAEAHAEASSTAQAAAAPTQSAADGSPSTTYPRWDGSQRTVR